MRKLFHKVYELIKRPYHFVPACPYCGSYVTGRYIIVWFLRKWMIEDALRQGEHIRLTRDENLRNIAFCIKCNYEWPVPLIETRITRRERNYQKSIRETDTYLTMIKTIKKYRKMKRWLDLF